MNVPTRQWSDTELQTVFETVAHANMGVLSDDQTVRCVAPRRFVFRKVYAGPGYPLDPRNHAARAIEQGLNLTSDNAHGTVDYRPLRDWLVEAIN